MLQDSYQTTHFERFGIEELILSLQGLEETNPEVTVFWFSVSLYAWRLVICDRIDRQDRLADRLNDDGVGLGIVLENRRSHAIDVVPPLVHVAGQPDEESLMQWHLKGSRFLLKEIAVLVVASCSHSRPAQPPSDGL